MQLVIIYWFTKIHGFRLVVIFAWFWKVGTDGQMYERTICVNIGDHYWLWPWVGLVDQLVNSFLHFQSPEPPILPPPSAPGESNSESILGVPSQAANLRSKSEVENQDSTFDFYNNLLTQHPKKNENKSDFKEEPIEYQAMMETQYDHDDRTVYERPFSPADVDSILSDAYEQGDLDEGHDESLNDFIDAKIDEQFKKENNLEESEFPQEDLDRLLEEEEAYLNDEEIEQETKERFADNQDETDLKYAEFQSKVEELINGTRQKVSMKKNPKFLKDADRIELQNCLIQNLMQEVRFWRGLNPNLSGKWVYAGCHEFFLLNSCK